MAQRTAPPAMENVTVPPEGSEPAEVIVAVIRIGLSCGCALAGADSPTAVGVGVPGGVPATVGLMIVPDPVKVAPEGGVYTANTLLVPAGNDEVAQLALPVAPPADTGTPEQSTVVPFSRKFIDPPGTTPVDGVTVAVRVVDGPWLEKSAVFGPLAPVGPVKVYPPWAPPRNWVLP